MDRDEMVEIEKKYEAKAVVSLSKKEALALAETSAADSHHPIGTKIHFIFESENTPWKDREVASVVSTDGKRATVLQMQVVDSGPGNAALPAEIFSKAIGRAKQKENITILFRTFEAKILIGESFETHWFARESPDDRSIKQVVFTTPKEKAGSVGLNLNYLAAAKKLADAADRPYAKLSLGETDLDPAVITVENEETERNYRLVIMPVRL